MFALLETQEGCAVRFGEQSTTRIGRANTFSLEHQRFWCDHRCWSSVWRRASDAHVLGPEEPEELARDSVSSCVLISRNMLDGEKEVILHLDVMQASQQVNYAIVTHAPPLY